MEKGSKRWDPQFERVAGSVVGLPACVLFLGFVLLLAFNWILLKAL